MNHYADYVARTATGYAARTAEIEVVVRLKDGRRCTVTFARAAKILSLFSDRGSFGKFLRSIVDSIQ